MKDPIKDGYAAHRKLHDEQWVKFYAHAFEETVKAWVDADRNDIDELIRLKDRIEFLKEYKEWLTRESYKGKTVEMERKRA